MAKIYPISTHKPQGSDSPRMGDDVIRALARAVIEWLGTDHFIEADFSGTPTGKDYDDDDGGKHNQITFRLAMDGTPSLGASDKGILYIKTVSGTPELHFRDAAGNEIRLTDNGGLSNILLKNNLPQINIQEADQSAPAGRWRIQSSDDVLTIQGRKDDDSDFVSILKLTRESHVEVGTATGGRRQVKNIADPSDDQDAATKAYVDGKIDAMLVVAHDYTLKCGSSGNYTTTLSTRSVSVTSGKQYLILVSGSTSTSNHKPRIALFVDGELKADIEIGAYDNHNHAGKGFFLQNIYTATSTGSINVQIKADAAVTLRSAQVLVIQIK